MSLFRYKGSKVWTMDFMFHGQRIRESTGTRSKTLAQKIESKRRQKLEEGAGESAVVSARAFFPLQLMIGSKTRRADSRRKPY